MKVTTTRISKVQQIYNNLSLALRVRAQTTTLIENFDVNRNGIFEEHMIINVLKSLIQADETQLRYVTSNMFRYDKDNDGIIGPKDLINFFLEVSWGEIAIQRLHRKGYYKNGSARMIDAQQFFATMKYILMFIQLQANENEVSSLFKEIDTNSDSLISYNEYFTFLRTYFGSQSEASFTQDQVKIPNKPSLPEDLILKNQQRFKRLILSQSRQAFINYNLSRNLKFTKEEVKNLLQDLFSIIPVYLDPTVQRLIATNYLEDFEKFTSILVILQFAQISLAKLHNQGVITDWRNRCLKKQDFVKVIRNGCSYMNVFPDKDLISTLFDQLSEIGSTIQYSEYRRAIISIFSSQQNDFNFVKDQLVDPLGFIRQRISSIRPPIQIGQNKAITDTCWRQVQKIFRKYDLTNTGISKKQIQQVISLVFRDITTKDKNVLVWSCLTFSDNSVIKFQQFASWAFKKLFRYGFVSYFTKQSTSIRIDLNNFKSLFKTIFWFLPQQLDYQITKLFNSLNQNKQNFISKSQLQNWIIKKLCNRL